MRRQEDRALAERLKQQSHGHARPNPFLLPFPTALLRCSFHSALSILPSSPPPSALRDRSLEFPPFPPMTDIAEQAFYNILQPILGLVVAQQAGVRTWTEIEVERLIMKFV
jgi:hypothetical protein